MKKIWNFVLLLSVIFLTGCNTNQPSQISGLTDGTVNLVKAETTEERNLLEPISPDHISQNVYEVLQNEWDSWNLLSSEEMMLSSHMPGHCQRSFDSWEECETFLGFSIPNLLENCSWLEKATYVGMPSGFQDASHVVASWYGTQDGHVEWISVESGYRSGEIRVMVAAALYGDPADTKPSDSGWSVELERQGYLAETDGALLQITSDSTENYFSNVAYLADGDVLYRFNIVGEPEAQTQVERTLEHVLSSITDTDINEFPLEQTGTTYDLIDISFSSAVDIDGFRAVEKIVPEFQTSSGQLEVRFASEFTVSKEKAKALGSTYFSEAIDDIVSLAAKQEVTIPPDLDDPVFQFFVKSQALETSNQHIIELVKFIDIYENYEYNSKMKELVSTLENTVFSSTTEFVTDTSVKELLSMMPVAGVSTAETAPLQSVAETTESTLSLS